MNLVCIYTRCSRKFQALAYELSRKNLVGPVLYLSVQHGVLLGYCSSLDVVRGLAGDTGCSVVSVIEGVNRPINTTSVLPVNEVGNTGLGASG